jgi:autotransporter-associated beta strand protein
MKPKLLVFLLLFFSFILSAYAGSATWKLVPTSEDWNTAANWTPETVPNDPTDVATFGSSNVAAIFLSAQTDVDTIIFDPNAAAYTISTAEHGLALCGSGVVNNSANEQNFVTGLLDGGILAFRNNATAGDAIFTVYGDAFQPYVYFYDNATAGDATFFNYGGFGGAVTWFFDSATAGNATFNNFSGGNGANDGVTVFEDQSSAGMATIICDGGDTVFRNHSTAANSTLIANLDTIFFLDHSTAGDAIMIANGARSSKAGSGTILFLSGDASAGDATLVANGGHNGGQGGLIAFYAETRGDNARVRLFDNGMLDISSHGVLAPMSIGSLEGTGTVALGANNLAVGRNHLNTTFSGVISDGRSGGSLTKVGTGTLALTGSNSYMAATTVQNGTLVVDNTFGSGTGTGPVQVVAGTLGGSGIIGGAVTIGTGPADRGILEPGIKAVGLLTIANTLTLATRGTYKWNVDTIGTIADEVAAAGVTISNGAIFSAILHGSTALPIGSVFSVIDNTAAQTISGTFSNLPDGAIVNVNGNNLQASYTGGDGNDLTLTVVP